MAYKDRQEGNKALAQINQVMDQESYERKNIVTILLKLLKC